MNFRYTIFICAVLYSLVVSGQQYENNWDSLDSRPLPGWYDEAKIGIFIHWGVFSVPSFGSEWFWQSWQGYHSLEYIKFMRDNYKPGFSYQEFAPMFTAEFFDPDEWAELFEDSGARYVVLTSKHHEGFTLWPSKFSWSWNSVDVGPKRDLVGDLATSIRSLNSTIKFGLYHSLYEWFNPLYMEDKKANYSTDNFVQTKTLPELYEIVNEYLPDIIWSDGEWEAPDTYWQSTTFLAWLFNESPVKDEVLVNDRWGSNTLCSHGSYYTCSDRFNPGVVQDHKWENCMTLDLESWGYRRNAKYDEYITIEKLLQTIVETVTCGGNILVNVGPTPEGTIPSIMEERLRQMGQWLNINGEAIYGSQPWTVQQDELTPGVWYSTNDDIIYAFVYEWPSQAKTVTLASVKSNATVSILGDTIQRSLNATLTPGGLVVTFPPREEVQVDWLWTLKIEA